MEDIKIIDLFWRRDTAAIEETDIKYGSNCRRISRDILKNREDAEECVDDGYLSLWNSIPPNRPSSFPAYLYRIVRNHSFNKLKERLAQKRGGGEAELILDELEGCLASDFSVEKAFKAKELSEQINCFLYSLSRDDRLIFTCRYWLMLQTAEIAVRLNFSESKVRTSLHRSRKKLHEYLLKEELI